MCIRDRHFILDLLGNVMRQNNGSSFIDHLGNNHNADFATRLHGVRTLNALMGIRNFLELLKTLYVTFEAFFASARTSGGNGIGGLDQNIEHAIRLDIGMVRLNRVNDFGPFTEATSKDVYKRQAPLRTCRRLAR